MPVTYQTEPWETYYRDVQPLWLAHWLEVGLDHAAIPLDPDVERYQAYADAGQLHILTMRDAGKLVGYHVALVSGHLHYKGTLMAFTDLYYVAPTYRKGMAGVRLFREAERALRALGVRRIQTATKLHAHLNMSRLLTRLGYQHVEAAFHKRLED